MWKSDHINIDINIELEKLSAFNVLHAVELAKKESYINRSLSDRRRIRLQNIWHYSLKKFFIAVIKIIVIPWMINYKVPNN